MTTSQGGKKHWEKVYSQKSPLEVSWYQDEPAASLRLIDETGINKHDYIIDIGGGASLLTDRLDQLGYSQLAVLDISTNSLEVSRKGMGKRKNNVEWFEADVTEFEPRHKYSLWHDRAVFHFLVDKEDRRKYVAVLKRALRHGGHVVIAAFAIGGPQKCSGLEVVQYDADKLLAEFGDRFLLVQELQQTHVTPAGAEQEFSYFRFIMR